MSFNSTEGCRNSSWLPSGESGQHVAHSMETRNLHNAFGGFKVLQGLDLVFQDDAITTILDPSGTGKSVLIKHLVGLLEPDEGEVLIFGQELWTFRRKSAMSCALGWGCCSRTVRSSGR